MKVLIITLLAIIIVPLIFGYFQNIKYENELKPTLRSQVDTIIAANGVQDAAVSMEKLDVSVSGVASDKKVIGKIKNEIDALGDGAVRVNTSGYNVQVFGEANLKKVDGEVLLAGNMSQPNAFLNQLNALNLGALGEVKSSEALDVDAVYRDSSALANEGLSKWTASYLALRGDRGYTVNASDDVIRPYGKVTGSLKNSLVSSAEGLGLSLDTSSFSMVDPGPAQFALNNAGGKISLSGKGPKDFDLESALHADHSDLVRDDFIGLHPSVSNPKFHQWVADYFKSNGQRGIEVNHDQVVLSGPTTPSLNRKWLGELSGQGLKPTSKLDIYPSEYHYPSYVLESKLNGATKGALLKAFALNQIFFDSGSSEVREDQAPKVDALAVAITAAGDGIKFVIGGHADSTGNAEFNKRLSEKRAAAVVAALGERQISNDKFTVVSFGAAKAKSGGSSESDRKVEIRIK